MLKLYPIEVTFQVTRTLTPDVSRTGEHAIMCSWVRMTKDALRQRYVEWTQDPGTTILEVIYPQAELARAENRYAVLDHARRELTFYLEFQEREVAGRKALAPTLRWRDLTIQEVAPLSSRILFEYLLPVHGLVSTNDIQADLSENLWRSCMGMAMERGLYVTFWNEEDPSKSYALESVWDIDRTLSLLANKRDSNRDCQVLLSESSRLISEVTPQ